jgi:hypothetical protein
MKLAVPEMCGNLSNDQGLLLWNKSRNSKFRVLPPNDEPRCPDGFSYSTPYNTWDGSYGFDVVVSGGFHAIADVTGIYQKACMCPARTLDHRDVLIRLIVKGDQGAKHYEALCHLATGHVAQCGDNHAVPVLRWLYHEDMTFAVFPLMSEGFWLPWYYDFGEVLDVIEQLLEVCPTVSVKANCE